MSVTRNARRRWKTVLYTLCFAALSMIDFVQNTQNGDVWGTAVNMTGLAVLVMVASVWPLRRLVSVWSVIWTVACAGVSVYAYYHMKVTGTDAFMGMFVWAFVAAVADLWWIVIFLVDLVKQIFIEKTRRVRLGKMAAVWIAMTVLMTLSRGEKVWPVWFLAMFGIFFLAPYGEEDGQALADGLIDGTILAFVGLQVFAWGFRPYDVVRYVGAYTNCNIAALHYLTAYGAVLMKLHMLQKKGVSKWRKLPWLLGACGILGLLFLTMGRTAWGTAVLLTVVYGIAVMRGSWRQKWGQIIARGAALTVGAVLLFPAVFGTVRWLPTILHHPVWFLQEYSEGKVHSSDPADSEKYVEMDEFLEEVFGRIKGTFLGKTQTNPLVLTARAAEEDVELELGDAAGMDTGLKIRLIIYKAYLRDLNLWGHTYGEGRYQFKDIDYMAWHPHDLWLEVAYRYGIPAGILFMVMTVWLLVYHFRGSARADGLARAAIPLMVCVLFFGYGTLEMVWNRGQYILALFFIAQHPLFYRASDAPRE